ncbi:restriction endonuclease subunit S [Microvirga sp. HBU67558]|uniref:restriction endonuclease subunit S n=1 Tax=Microvirga TaxID=186650 RepID=UPI001B3633C7|nr:MULTISPECIES: restriction endonuclease subunit S [unclassified Microvirga]MBQ0824260.1 restriction endonuclease subunit S [Microvirga sp. HBU67558]
MLERSISKAGWARVAFGDVVRLSKARVADPEAAGIERVVGLEHVEPGDLRIRRWGDVADGTTFTTLFKPGQVLFGKRRAYQRKVAVADFEGVCSGDIYVLEPANDRLVPELLPFLCQTDAFFDHAVGTSAGSLSPRTNWTSLASFEFLLPPIQEQARLAEALSSLERTSSLLQEAGKHLQQVLDALFETIIVQSKEKGLIRTLADVCALITDGTHQPPQFVDAGVPFLFVKTISGGNVDWSHISYVSQETYDELTKRNRPKLGDVLYTAVGATYGVAVAVDFDKPFVFQRHIAHLVPDQKLILPGYLTLFLNSRYGKQQADSSAVGSAQPTITLESLRRYWCPCPPIETQREQLIEVQQIERQQKSISDRLSHLRVVRRTIMETVF